MILQNYLLLVIWEKEINIMERRESNKW